MNALLTLVKQINLNGTYFIIKKKELSRIAHDMSTASDCDGALHCDGNGYNVYWEEMVYPSPDCDCGFCNVRYDDFVYYVSEGDWDCTSVLGDQNI